MKLEDVIERTVRIIRKIEQCNWTKDNGWECSTECPVWNIEGCSDGIRYMSEDDFQKYIEAIVRQFHKEYSEGLDKSMDEMDAVEDKKETTIEDVVDYLEEMVEKFITLCRKTHCNECRLRDKESNKMCSFLTKLESITVEGKLEEASKVLKFESFKKYPDPNDTVTSFIQNKVNAAESESEKSEYQKILKRLQEE